MIYTKEVGGGSYPDAPQDAWVNSYKKVKVKISFETEVEVPSNYDMYYEIKEYIESLDRYTLFENSKDFLIDDIEK